MNTFWAQTSTLFNINRMKHGAVKRSLCCKDQTWRILQAWQPWRHSSAGLIISAAHRVEGAFAVVGEPQIDLLAGPKWAQLKCFARWVLADIPCYCSGGESKSNEQWLAKPIYNANDRAFGTVFWCTFCIQNIWYTYVIWLCFARICANSCDSSDVPSAHTKKFARGRQLWVMSSGPIFISQFAQVEEENCKSVLIEPGPAWCQWLCCQLGLLEFMGF